MADATSLSTSDTQVTQVTHAEEMAALYDDLHSIKPKKDLSREINLDIQAIRARLQKAATFYDKGIDGDRSRSLDNSTLDQLTLDLERLPDDSTQKARLNKMLETLTKISQQRSGDRKKQENEISKRQKEIANALKRFETTS